MVFLSVNTPTKTKGVGAGQASDLRWIEASARQVTACAQGHTIVVEKSTLPVRTAETVQTILSAVPAAEGKTFSVLLAVAAHSPAGERQADRRAGVCF